VREIRKTVTVLFADVTGSTALGERLDPESLRRVMARYFVVARTCLERHGGTVEKFIGDAVVAVFGVPTMHEDDALRALRAAAELRDSIASLDDELERDHGVSLLLRTGVNTGQVVTGTEERLATGDAVNVAARLEQAAQPGEILIGEQSRRLARGAIEVERVEPLALKGKAEPLASYRLLRVLEGAPAFERRLDAPLVGRQQELTRARAIFDEAVAERRCRLLTVFGPPGIGKSRLAREVDSALAGEATVLSGRCLPYGEGITYWPLVEIFQEAHAEDELAAALSAVAPEEIFLSVRKALERRSRQHPLALIVEDLHWAEPTLLDLIEHLTAWTRDAPLLLLCLARPELLEERRGWGGQAIMLEPLSEAESDHLIEELLGGLQLEATTRIRIREVAEGNPLFVEQLLAMLAEGDDLEHVPATMQALLAARLDALPVEERKLLERASVVGLEFEWEVLAELSPDGRRPPGAQLEALVRKELIRPHEAIADTFRFRHMLIRDAAYERISKELRSDLHERVAAWLDGRGDEFEEIIGYHLEQAYRCVVELGPPGERGQRLAEQAAERLSAAGRRAYARADASAAVNLLERATALLPSSNRKRLGLLPSLGRALMELGQLERSDAVLSDTVESARAAGEQLAAADAAVALAYLRTHTRPELSDAEVARELEGVIHVLRDLGDKAGLARALGLAGQLRHWRGEAAAAMGDLEQAVTYARDVGDRTQEATVLHYVLMAVLWGPTSVDEGLERVADIRDEAHANRRLEISLLRTQGQLEAMQGRLDVGRDLLAQATTLADELGLEFMLVGGVAHQAGYVELLAGDALAAERVLRPACEALERMGDWGHLATLAPKLADALFIQGANEEEALRLTELAERSATPGVADEDIGWRRVRAKLLARQGDHHEAERLAREATERAALTDLLDDRAQALADLAEVLRLGGRSEESAAVLEEAIDLHEQKGNVVGAEKLRAVLATPPIEMSGT
jgi:class 3 adenylate cyclase/tetratricopeptide (TPR) repeat protein